MRLTRTLDGAKNIALFSAPIGGEHATRGQSGDRVRLVLPFGPGGSLREVGAQGGADEGSLGVAKHVDEVQIGRHQRLQRAIEHQGFNRASPVTQGFARPWQVDTPLVHVQSLGAQVHLSQVHKAFGVGRAEELAHLDGARFAILLTLPAEPRACEPPGGGSTVGATSESSWTPSLAETCI